MGVLPSLKTDFVGINLLEFSILYLDWLFFLLKIISTLLLELF